MSVPFESINLDQSTRQPPVSLPLDDEPDPADFLSQSPVLHNSFHSDRRQSNDSGSNGSNYNGSNYGSGSNFNGSNFNGSTLHESLANSLHGSLLGESLFAASPRPSQSQSPLEYLLHRHDALSSDMRAAIGQHRSLLENGDDCSAARATIAALLEAMGENSLSLHEIYTKERATVDTLHGNFVAWDKKRAKVLRRIQAIRSDNSAYGAKLDELLGERAAVDDEIAACEARLVSLRAKRAALTHEVGETVSVLESKSAKYVNLFRSLETRGSDAIADYLQSNGVSDSDMGTFLRYEDVNVSFGTPQRKVSDRVSDKSNGLIDRANGNGSKDTVNGGVGGAGSPAKVPSSKVNPDPSDIGIHALEISEHAMPQPESSAYEKGYAKGSQQFQLMKSGFTNLVHNVFHTPSTTKKSPSRLEDSQNLITEKIDVEPVLDLLSSKSAVLMDSIIRTSKMAENFHQQSTVWKDTVRYLESQEELLLASLSQAADVQEARRILLSCHDFLNESIQLHAPKTPNSSSKDYLSFLLRQEFYTVCKALDQLSGTSSYSRQVSQPDLSELEPPRSNKAPSLNTPMTFISSEQLYRSDRVVSKPQSPPKPTFTSSFGKSLKKE